MFYPPSILVIADNCGDGVKLSRLLENRGCQVFSVDTASDERFKKACENYFDLIVLHLEQFSDSSFEVSRKLTTWPELAGLPVVLLTRPNLIDAARKALASRLVYCIPKDDFAESYLLRVIEEIHYLTYRYS